MISLMVVSSTLVYLDNSVFIITHAAHICCSRPLLAPDVGTSDLQFQTSVFMNVTE